MAKLTGKAMDSTDKKDPYSGFDMAWEMQASSQQQVKPENSLPQQVFTHYFMLPQLSPPSWWKRRNSKK